MGARTHLAAVVMAAGLAVSGARAAESDADAAADVLRDAAAPSVTFEDVMADPTNPEVNLGYARKLVKEGRLELAAVTLERILLLNPELDRVRLFYAVVLYRLNNLTEAEAELASLHEDGDLPSNLQAEVERYLDAVRRRQRAFHGTLTLGAGAHYDTNRNSYPQSDQFRILDTLIDGSEEENDDIGRMATGTVDVTYDPGHQRLRELYATATGLIDDQVEEDPLDLMAGILEVGALYDATVVEVIPHLRHEHLRLDSEMFARINEAGLRLARQFRRVDGLDAHIEGRAAYEEFSNSDALRFNNEQNGQLYEMEIGAGYRLNDAMRLAASYVYGDKDAKEDFHDYESHKFHASYTWILPNRSFAIASGSVEFLDFDDVDPFVSPTISREDTDSRLRLTYGIPVTAVADAFGEAEMPDYLHNLVLSASGEYFRSDSNITNFDYENWRGSVLVTKRFSF